MKGDYRIWKDENGYYAQKMKDHYRFSDYITYGGTERRYYFDSYKACLECMLTEIKREIMINSIKLTQEEYDKEFR